MAEEGASQSLRDGNFETNLQEQKDEVLALQSIYEGGDTERLKILGSPSDAGEGLFVLHFSIPVKAETQKVKVDIWIHTQEEPDGASSRVAPPDVGKAVTFTRSDSGQKWIGSFNIKFLSPLGMQVILPPNYPSDSPPVFTLSCDWLRTAQLSTLCRQLDQLWNEMQNMPIIFTWIDWMENNLISDLGISDSVFLMPLSDLEEDGDVRVVVEGCDLGQKIAGMLQYNREQENIAFCRENQTCHVCFDERPGTHFFRMMDCPHHFCRECMMEYCKLHVRDGTVEALVCPDTECKAIVPPHIVQAVLHPKDLAKWERLLLQKTLDHMTDIVWCPRCNNPVIKEMEESLNLAHCTTCFYSFCTECQEVWHQGVPCMTAEDKLKYAEQKLNHKSEAGKRRFAEIQRKLLDDMKNREFMDKKTVTCPHCRIKVEKNGGCNKMSCKCGAAFCWLCGEKILGYNHFTNSRCGLMDQEVATCRLVRQLPEVPEKCWGFFCRLVS